MSVARAQREISSEEFAEWVEFEQESPGEPERSDMRAALVAATTFNVMRAKGPAAKLQDFLLRFGRPRQQDWREMKAHFEMWAAMKSKPKGKR